MRQKCADREIAGARIEPADQVPVLGLRVGNRHGRIDAGIEGQHIDAPRPLSRHAPGSARRPSVSRTSTTWQSSLAGPLMISGSFAEFLLVPVEDDQAARPPGQTRNDRPANPRCAAENHLRQQPNPRTPTTSRTKLRISHVRSQDRCRIAHPSKTWIRADIRTGRNSHHALVRLLRQSVFGRLRIGKYTQNGLPIRNRCIFRT